MPWDTRLCEAGPRLLLRFAIFLLWHKTCREIFCLRMLSLDLPASVMRGDSLWLNCTLDLESDDLYSVKWYKNDVEFYRYLPRDKPSNQKYDLPGVFVSLQKSNRGNVFLRTSDLDTEGLYRCEASAESPTFQTVEAEKYISVFVIPQEDPEIEGNQPKYQVDDFVNVTCRSSPSKPAASLRWFINGKEAPPGFTVGPFYISHLNGLQTSILGLRFLVNPRHLLEGKGAITLKCTSIVSHSYSMSSQELVVGDRTSHDAASALMTATRQPSINQYYSGDGPVISGGQSYYRVGDFLNINCSSSKYHKTPELHWFLNDREVQNMNVVRYEKVKHPDGQETATIGLQFRVSPDHFHPNDEMRLKCTATLSEVINMRSDERTLGDNQRTSELHVSENVGLVSEQSCGFRLHQTSFGVILLLCITLFNAI